MKGDHKEECNRTVCSNSPAVYYNHSTRKYYCIECAELINRMNRADAFRMFGHDLCTLAFDHMTPTAEKLIGSPSFWIMRVEQQVEYILRFKGNPKVKESAIDVLEMCQYNAIKAATTAFEKGIVSQVISDIGAQTH